MKKIADIYDLINRLNAQQRYMGNVITSDEEAWAKEHGYVILYGASDNLAEFEGAIRDEKGCFDGGRIFEQNGYYIDAVWHDEGVSWTYNSNIPHYTFPVYDHNKSFYCIGIVFNIKDCEVSA